MRALALPFRVCLPAMPFCSLAEVALEWINQAFGSRFSFFSPTKWVGERMGTSVAASKAAGAQTTFTFRTVLVLHAVALGLFVVRIVCVCAVVCARIPPSLTARAGRYERRTPLVSSCGFAEQISGCQRAACRFVTAVYGSAMRTRILENTDFAPTFFRCCRKPADHSALWYHAISPCRPHACKRLNWNGHEGQRWVMPKSNGERWHWRQASSHEQVSVPRTSAGRLLGINKMQDDNRDQGRR